MKTILVPTDFSDNANIALNYACNLALTTNAKIVLLNSFQLPASTNNVMINFMDILEEDSKKDLAKNLKLLRDNKIFDSVEVETFSCYGYLSAAINKAVNKFNVNLVVMGTAGSSNLASRLFGSNTTDAIKNTDLPILVVPNKAEYSPWKNITFASNIQSSTNDCPFKPLKELMTMPTCKLNVITVAVNASDIDQTKIMSRIEPKLTGIDFEINVVENTNIANGILDYIENNDTDLLVLIRKNYGFIESILHSSVTKKIALYGKKPLLLYKACS